MDWLSAVLGVNEAIKQSGRDAEARSRETQREAEEDARDLEKFLGKARKLDEAAYKDPLQALGITYQSGSGFSFSPIEIRSGSRGAEVCLGVDDSQPTFNEGFRPKRAKTREGSVEPIDLLITRWATIIALRLASHSGSYRLKAPWHKKSDPASSSIYLLDPHSSTYYYPVASTLSGEVLCNHPRIALVAFQPFRRGTRSVQLHFSGVCLSSNRADKHSFHLTCQHAKLVDLISQTLGKPSLDEQLAEVLCAKKRQETKGVLQGCLLVLVVLCIVVLLLAVLA